MLEGVSESGHSSIVRWLPHGRAFKIYNKSLFVEHVLPVYFPAQTEYASFQRQLNIYGFVRLNCKGPDKNGYYHEFLLRGRQQLATLIPRKAGKGSTARYVYDPDTAPYFHGMTWLAKTVHALGPDSQMACDTVHDPESHDTPSNDDNETDHNNETSLADILDTSDDDVAQNSSHDCGKHNGSAQRASRLADWASFLEDMDFDAKSDS
jgi:HSF-type DNA-binding